MKKKRLLALVLSICMLFSFAATLPEGVFTDNSSITASAETNIPQSAYYAQALEVREHLKNHDEEFSVTIELDEEPDDDGQFVSSVYDLAVAHTGNPNEGDYLKYHYLINQITLDVSALTYKITYDIDYFSTVEQEQQAQKKADRIINYLELDSKSDYQKILEIYNYIAQNVEYDFDRKDDNSTEIEHSAYAALCERKAVCQGYALSLYRLMLLAGIDCRIVTGKLNGEDHAWNIVRLNGKYYYLDATNDRFAESYSHFMVTNNELPGYSLEEKFLTDEYITKYPISNNKYEDVTRRQMRTTNDGFVYLPSLDETSIVSYKGTQQDVIVPALIGEAKVKSIGFRAFEEDWPNDPHPVKSITFSEGIEVLSNCFASHCMSLEKVVIPSTMTLSSLPTDTDNSGGITLVSGMDGFAEEAQSLTTIVVSPQNPYLKTIDGVLYDSSVKYLVAYPPKKTNKAFTVPSTVISIIDDAFKSNKYLEEIILPDGLMNIGYWAFACCSSLKKINLPSSLKENSVGQGAFAETKIENLYISKGYVGPLYSEMFDANIIHNLHITIEEGNPKYKIVNHCLLSKFERNGEIETGLEIYFFNQDPSDTLIVPDEVTCLGWQLFLNPSYYGYNKQHIKKLVIGPNVRGANDGGGLLWALEGRPNCLREIEIVNNPNYTVKNNCIIDNKTGWLISVVNRDVTGRLDIPEEAKSIEGCSISGCDKIEEVSIPNTVTSIDHDAFAGCKSIKSMVIPESVTYLGDGAFYECISLETVNIPSKIVSIEHGLFKECYGLKSITIPDGVKTIGINSFLGCHSLEQIVLPSGLLSIGISAFSGCNNLKSIEIPKSVETIESGTFCNCSKLESIVMPEGISSIGGQAFMGCSSLNIINIPQNVDYIGNNALGLTWNGVENIKDEHLTIFCYKDSVAQQYAQNNNLHFVLVDGDELGHDFVETMVKPTCTEEGYTLHTCSNCDSYYKDKYTEPAGHDFTEWIITTEPTCIDYGEKTSKCKNCEETEVQLIEPLGHNYVETVVSPTCISYGYTFHQCTRCGEGYYDDNTESLGHDYVETVVAPTCIAKGYTNHKCSRCDYEYNDTETDMVAHKFGEWTVITKPTCTSKGVETRKCENCDKTETRDVDATGHDYVDIVVAPTCTAKGYTNHKCSRCGDEYNDSETSIVDHTYGDWDIKSYDSKTGESKLERKCINCTHTETKTEKDTVQRYAGSGRFATAAEISKASFETAKTVVLAYGLNSADALAGVPLAAKCNAPILLTNTKTLPQETLAEIKRLKAKNIIILGGEGAIGTDVENLLKKEGLTTQRIAGKTRFGTATAIAEQLTENPEEIFFVYAFNFADALSASTVAAVKGAPIIYLKTKGDIDADTAAYLEKVKGKVKKAYVIGGTGVINDEMMNKAKNALGLDTITRVAGANRYATCIEVNNTFKDYLTGNGICVAKGLDFPDALAGGVFAALKNMPLFLADGSLKDVQTSYLGNKDISNVYVFGGTGAVPNDLIEKLAKAS